MGQDAHDRFLANRVDPSDLRGRDADQCCPSREGITRRLTQALPVLRQQDRFEPPSTLDDTEQCDANALGGLRIGRGSRA